MCELHPLLLLVTATSATLAQTSLMKERSSWREPAWRQPGVSLAPASHQPRISLPLQSGKPRGFPPPQQYLLKKKGGQIESEARTHNTTQPTTPKGQFSARRAQICNSTSDFCQSPLSIWFRRGRKLDTFNSVTARYIKRRSVFQPEPVPKFSSVRSLSNKSST